MEKHELLHLLQEKLDEGVALAQNQSSPADPAPDSDAPKPPAWPTMSEVAEGLLHGFTAEQEQRARESTAFQRLVCAFWRVKPVSLWLLARYIVEGESFPFARALRLHLDDNVRHEDQVLSRSTLAGQLADAIRRAHAWSERWTSLRDSVLSWEIQTARFTTQVPRVYGFAEDTPEPFEEQHELNDGVVVTLEEVRTSRLQVAVARPAETTGPDSLFVTLTGDGEGRPIVIEVKLAGSGRYVAGQAEGPEFREASNRLGQNWVVMVSAERPPDMPE